MLAVKTGEAIQKSMEGIALITITINFFVSVSMKQILKAVKVMQIIAFFVLLNMDYTPFTFVFF